MRLRRVDEIKEKYNIKSDDLKIILQELTHRLKNVHPDCKIEDDTECKELLEDRDYIRTVMNGETELLVIEEMRSLVQMMQDNQMMVKQDVELHNKLVSSLDAQMNKFRGRCNRPKYNLAAITAIFTFIWFIPERMISNPVIKLIVEKLSDFSKAQLLVLWGILWIDLIIITLCYWVIVAKIGQREKNLLDKIKLESVQNEIFMRYIENLDTADRFSKKEFMDYVGNELDKELKCEKFNTNAMFSKLLRIRLEIGEDILQSVADLILHRAIEHGLIEKTDAQSLIDYYVIKK